VCQRMPPGTSRNDGPDMGLDGSRWRAAGVHSGWGKNPPFRIKAHQPSASVFPLNPPPPPEALLMLSSKTMSTEKNWGRDKQQRPTHAFVWSCVEHGFRCSFKFASLGQDLLDRTKKCQADKNRSCGSQFARELKCPFCPCPNLKLKTNQNSWHRKLEYR